MKRKQNKSNSKSNQIKSKKNIIIPRTTLFLYDMCRKKKERIKEYIKNQRLKEGGESNDTLNTYI